MERKKFEETITGADCIEFWSSKTKEEVLELLGPDTSNMVGFDQNNPHHCYDLFLHSLHTVRNVQKRLALFHEKNVYLLAAAFFHDIGKVSTAKLKENRLVFYGHAKKSAVISRRLLKTLGYEENEIEQICFYILHHDDFISYVLPSEKYDRENPYLKEITKENICAHMIQEKQKMKDIRDGDFSELWKFLMILCYADAEAQSDIVIQNNSITDTKEHKLQKVKEIEQIIRSL